MLKPSNVGVIVAARMGSSRLPGKALLPLLNVPMLKLLLMRLKTSQYASQIILATTNLVQDNILRELAHEMGCQSLGGDPENLIARYVECAIHYQVEYVVRVTADCPFVDGQTLDYFLEQAFAEPNDFTLATTKEKFPIGIDFELFSTERMAQLHTEKSLCAQEREHLTLHFYLHPDRYVIKKIEPPGVWNSCPGSFTIDTAEDYQKALLLTRKFNTPYFSVSELIEQAQIQPLILNELSTKQLFSTCEKSSQ